MLENCVKEVLERTMVVLEFVFRKMRVREQHVRTNVFRQNVWGEC